MYPYVHIYTHTVWTTATKLGVITDVGSSVFLRGSEMPTIPIRQGPSVPKIMFDLLHALTQTRNINNTLEGGQTNRESKTGHATLDDDCITCWSIASSLVVCHLGLFLWSLVMPPPATAEMHMWMMWLADGTAVFLPDIMTYSRAEIPPKILNFSGNFCWCNFLNVAPALLADTAVFS